MEHVTSNAAIKNWDVRCKVYLQRKMVVVISYYYSSLISVSKSVSNLAGKVVRIYLVESIE